jgi:hypothetical protein
LDEDFGKDKLNVRRRNCMPNNRARCTEIFFCLHERWQDLASIGVWEAGAPLGHSAEELVGAALAATGVYPKGMWTAETFDEHHRN